MNKNNNITVIHIIAALLVIFGHQFDLLRIPYPTIMGIDPHGLGVRVLFLISGYLVSGSFLRTTKCKYFIKRITRLYPPLIVCLIITVLCLFPFSEQSEGYWGSAVNYIFNNLRMQPQYNLADLFANNPFPTSVNGSLWTLPIEMACYILLIPVACFFRHIVKRKKAVAAIIMAAILITLSAFDIYRALHLSDNHWVWHGVDWIIAINLIIWFMIGISFRMFKLEKYCNWQIALLFSVVFLLSTGVFRAFLIPYVIGYDVMCFAFAEKPLFASTIKRDICYGLYLYAFPIQQLLIYLLIVRSGLNISVYILYALSVAITWLFAEMNYRFVEIPSAKLFDRLLGKSHLQAETNS